MLYAVATRGVDGSVLDFHECENGIDEAFRWMAACLTPAEGDESIAEDVVHAEWSRAVSYANAHGGSAESYFAVRDQHHLVRFGLFSTEPATGV